MYQSLANTQLGMSVLILVTKVTNFRHWGWCVLLLVTQAFGHVQIWRFEAPLVPRASCFQVPTGIWQCLSCPELQHCEGMSVHSAGEGTYGVVRQAIFEASSTRPALCKSRYRMSKHSRRWSSVGTMSLVRTQMALLNIISNWKWTSTREESPVPHIYKRNHDTLFVSSSSFSPPTSHRNLTMSRRPSVQATWRAEVPSWDRAWLCHTVLSVHVYYGSNNFGSK